MSTAASGITAGFQTLQAVPGGLRDVSESLAALRSLATVPGAAGATGCPETSAAIVALGAEVVLWVAELVGDLAADAEALEQSLTNYKNNESGISFNMSQIATIENVVGGATAALGSVITNAASAVGGGSAQAAAPPANQSTVDTGTWDQPEASVPAPSGTGAATGSASANAGQLPLPLPPAPPPPSPNQSANAAPSLSQVVSAGLSSAASKTAAEIGEGLLGDIGGPLGAFAGTVLYQGRGMLENAIVDGTNQAAQIEFDQDAGAIGASKP